MKKILFSFVVLAAIALISGTANAQSISADASANLITPISIAKTADLHFGTLSVSTTAGTCILATAGTRTVTGGVSLSTASPVAATSKYSVAGQANTIFAITLPTTFNVTSATNNMAVNTMTARVGGAGGNVTTGTLSATGAATIEVGGTLNVGASQVAGLYKGTFIVTVAYN